MVKELSHIWNLYMYFDWLQSQHNVHWCNAVSIKLATPALPPLYGTITFTFWKRPLVWLKCHTLFWKEYGWERRHVKQVSLNNLCKIGLLTTSTLVSSWLFLHGLEDVVDKNAPLSFNLHRVRNSSKSKLHIANCYAGLWKLHIWFLVHSFLLLKIVSSRRTINKLIKSWQQSWWVLVQTSPSMPFFSLLCS